jgi:hypothetical protein
LIVDDVETVISAKAPVFCGDIGGGITGYSIVVPVGGYVGVDPSVV